MVAVTFRLVVAIAGWWLLVALIVGVAFGRWVKRSDAARQLAEEERQRREKLDELDNRHRRRPQR